MSDLTITLDPATLAALGIDTSQLQTKSTDSTFATINSDYAKEYAKAQADGKSDAEWVSSDTFASFQKKVVDATKSYNNVDALQSSLDFQKSLLADPTYGANANTLTNAFQTRLDQLKNPNTTPLNEGALTDVLDASKQRVDDLYNSLTAFQTQQMKFADDLLLQAQQAAQQPVAGLPEKSGKVIYGGSANEQQTGLADLMLG